ncbi:14570_t:CDS:1, partial [Cetraspora pellucida]
VGKNGYSFTGFDLVRILIGFQYDIQFCMTVKSILKNYQY